MKWRRFHANCAFRRWPDQGLTWWEAAREVQMEVVVGAWRRKRAGIVKRTTKKRVVQRLKWDFFGLLLKAIFEKGLRAGLYGERK